MTIALGIVSILLIISEVMPFSESVKSNGIFQGFLNILKSLKESLTVKK